MPNYFGIMKYSVDNDINILTILLNIKHVFSTYVTFYQSRSQPMWNHFSQSNLCFLNTFHHTTLNCHCFCTDLYHHFFFSHFLFLTSYPGHAQMFLLQAFPCFLLFLAPLTYQLCHVPLHSQLNTEVCTESV